MWQHYLKLFRAHLLLERAMSPNTLLAYEHDLLKLHQFLHQILREPTEPDRVQTAQLQQFLTWMTDIGLATASHARILSAIKTFYRFLKTEHVLTDNPAEALQAPRLARYLPVVLSVAEVDALIEAVDLSKAEGQRNRAIIETLYSCGMRVSELTEMRLSMLWLDEGFVKILGKGKKERLVPISPKARNEIQTYCLGSRTELDIKPGHEDYLFLNRRGQKLTRVMIFNIVKEAALRAGNKKNISPHSFRHTFATHLVEGGADLRAVQDMLGHETILTTEIYTHLDRAFLRQNLIDYHPRGLQSNEISRFDR